MRVLFLLTVTGLACATAWGQAATERRAVAEPAAPAQRRSDLRQALKTAPAGVPAKPEQAGASPAANRQLSAKERTELRNLLRQQGGDARPAQHSAPQ